jgi:hypothetical protein
MDTLFAFAYFLLGFVPLAAGALIIVTALWAATKLFPRFGAMVERFDDVLFGSDAAEYDDPYDGFRIHPNNFVYPSSR